MYSPASLENACDRSNFSLFEKCKLKEKHKTFSVSFQVTKNNAPLADMTRNDLGQAMLVKHP